MAAPLSGKTAPIIIDKEELKKLAGINCTMKEMAAFFNCSVDTLERNYAEVIEKGREIGKASIRRILLRQAENGNSVALRYFIWNILREKLEDPADKILLKSQADEASDKLSTVSTQAILEMVRNHNSKAS